MRRADVNRFLRSAVVALVGLFLVGCSTFLGSANPTAEPAGLPSPTAGLPPTPVHVPTGNVQAAASPPAGWTEHEEPGGEFALALPSGWQEVGADPRMMAGALEALRRQSPELAALLESASEQMAGSEIRLLALDLSAESLTQDFPANLTVLRWPVDASASLAELGESNVRELARLSQVSGPVGRETVQLPAGEALRQSYRVSVDAGQGSQVDLSLTQLLLVRGGDGYVLTLATTPEARGRYEPVFDGVARSLRWL